MRNCKHFHLDIWIVANSEKKKVSAGGEWNIMCEILLHLFMK